MNYNVKITIKLINIDSYYKTLKLVKLKAKYYYY